jgi:PAS domain S-box-containing protein
MSTKQHFPFPLLQLKWRRLTIAERGAIAINIPLLCLLLSFGSHLFVRQSTLQSEQRVEHIQNVLTESRAVLLDLLNAETSVRGYYNTRQKEFLAPYHLGVTRLPQTFDRFKLLVQSDPQQLQQANVLEQLAQKKLAVLKDGIDKLDRGEVRIDANGLPMLKSIEGKVVMDRFRSSLADFEAQEQKSLEASNLDLQHLRDLNVLVIVLGVAIGCIGVAIAKRLFNALAQELRERESMLQGSNNLIHAIFSNVVDGVVTIDPYGRIESCNQAAVDMFGYDRSALVGQSWMILLGTNSQNLVPIPNPGKVQAGDLGHLWQTMGQRKHGDYFPIEISISNIELDNRQIAIVRDITRRQQIEANLKERAEELAQVNQMLSHTNITLEERNRELDRFAYVASHDLKAPLRAIANLSTWIAEDLDTELPPENHNQLHLLRGRVNRMEALLDGLLEYSRIGRKSTKIEQTDVNELIVDIIQLLDPPRTFRIEIEPNLPIFTTRRLLLRQVFICLIDNAIDHHPSANGMVKIAFKDCGDRYEFSVTDDGQGIEPQYHERVYNIFQTLQARDTHESTGVGLAIAKKIVETEGGAINLKSALGQGATFSFTWLKEPK